MTVLPGAVVGDLLERLAQERRRVVLDGFEPHADEWSAGWRPRGEGRQSRAARASRAAADAEVLERLADDLAADQPGQPTAAEVVLALSMAIRREPDRAAIIVDTMLTDHPRMAVVIVATALRICPGLRREILRQARRHQPFARHPFILGLLLAFVAKVLADSSAEAAEPFAGAESPSDILAALGRHVAAPRAAAEADRGGRDGRGIGFGPVVAAPFVAAVLAAGDAWSRTPPDDPAGQSDVADGEVATRGPAEAGSFVAGAADPAAVAADDGGEPSRRVAEIADGRGAAAPDGDAAAISPAFRPDAAGALAEPVTAAARAVAAAPAAARSPAVEVPPDLAGADGAAAPAAEIFERPQAAIMPAADDGRDAGSEMVLRGGEPGWSLAARFHDPDAPATGPAAATTGGEGGLGNALPAPGRDRDDAGPAVDRTPPAPDLAVSAGRAADAAAGPFGPDGEAALPVTAQADLGAAPTAALDVVATLLDGDAALATAAAVAATVGGIAVVSTAVDLALLGAEGTAIDAGLAVTIGLGDEEPALTLAAATNLDVGGGGVEADATVTAEVGALAVAAALEVALPGDGGPVAAALGAAVAAGDAVAIAAAAGVGLSTEGGLDADAALSADIGAAGVSATAAAEATIDVDGVAAEAATAAALGPIAESAVAAEVALPSDGGPVTLAATADAGLADLAMAELAAAAAVDPEGGLAAAAALSTSGPDLPPVEAAVALEVGPEPAVEASLALDELLSVDLSLGGGLALDLDLLPDAPPVAVVGAAVVEVAVGAVESLLGGSFAADDPEPPPAAPPPVASVLYSLGGLFA